MDLTHLIELKTMIELLNECDWMVNEHFLRDGPIPSSCFCSLFYFLRLYRSFSFILFLFIIIIITITAIITIIIMFLFFCCRPLFFLIVFAFLLTGNIVLPYHLGRRCGNSSRVPQQKKKKKSKSIPRSALGLIKSAPNSTL